MGDEIPIWQAVLIAAGVGLVIVWIAVFICALSDKLRGYEPPFTEPEDEAEPHLQQLSWWQRAIRAPLYFILALFAVVIGVVCLPMIVLDRFWSSRVKPTGKQ